MQRPVLAKLARLMQEFVLESWSCIMSQRLQFLHQSVAPRSLGARESVQARAAAGGVGGAGDVGKELPSLLPKSVPGSKAAQRHLIDDGMALVATYGNPGYVGMSAPCLPHPNNHSCGLHVPLAQANPPAPLLRRLWITVTCNPLWEEIQGALLPGQTAADRPDLTSRVFKQKLNAILEGIRSGLFFGGKAKYIMYVIEFQVRRRVL